MLELKARAEEAFGQVDIYVSNAARRLHKDFWETTDEDWHRYLNQQLTASWYLAKAFAPGMRERGWGRIMHMNGPGRLERRPHPAAALDRQGRPADVHQVARPVSLGPYGITVNDINPGFADTIRDMETHPGLTRERSDQIARRHHPDRPPAAARGGRLGVRVPRGRALGRHQRHRHAR